MASTVPFVFVPTVTYPMFAAATASPKEAAVRLRYYIGRGIITVPETVGIMLLNSEEEVHECMNETRLIDADMIRRFLKAVNHVAYKEQEAAAVAAYQASREAVKLTPPLAKEPVVKTESAKDEPLLTRKQKKLQKLILRDVGVNKLITSEHYANGVGESVKTVSNWRNARYMPNGQKLEKALAILTA